MDLRVAHINDALNHLPAKSQTQLSKKSGSLTEFTAWYLAIESPMPACAFSPTSHRSAAFILFEILPGEEQ